MFFALGFFILPLLFTTLILAGHARWSWMKTMDKILNGMNIDEVRQRVEWAERHKILLKFHAIGLTAIFILVLTLSLFFSDFNSTRISPLLWVFIWFYTLFVPHLLGLYLYHVRWNPKTILRKQKLDADDTYYEGNYELDADAQYGINEEGELINLLELDEDEARKMRLE